MLSTITSSFGRMCDIISCASATVGMILVLTSSARACMRSPLFFMARYIASRTAACNTTAAPVNATNHVIVFIRIPWLLSIEPARKHSRRDGDLERLGATTGFRCRLVISLTSRLVSGAELLFLLAHDFTPTIGPLLRLVPRVPRAATHVFAALFGARPQCLARLAARTRRVQHASQRSQPESCKKPHQSISVTIRHTSSYKRVSMEWY